MIDTQTYVEFLLSMPAKTRIAWRGKFDRDRHQASLENRMVEFWKEKELEMARKPKAKPQGDNLISALKFVSVATKDNPHVRTFGKQIVGFSTPIAAGHPIDEELNLSPDLALFQKAVTRAGKTFTISESEGGRMTISGEKLRAQIPCLSSDYLSDFQPDYCIAPLNDEIRTGFGLLAPIANEGGLKVYEASILLQNLTMLATDSKIAIEFYHANSLPPNLIVPKLFADAVAKSPYAVVGFGWTEGRSITIWFENSSWIKTSLYVDKWPDLSALFATTNNWQVCPETLFEGVKAVMDFSADNVVKFEESFVHALSFSGTLAEFEVKGLSRGLSFDGELLKKCEPFAAQIQFSNETERMFFCNDKARGVIMSFKS